MRLWRCMGASILTMAACLLSDAAAAQNNHGAIAYSPGSGAHGWSNDFSTREAAEETAKRNCQKHASDCTVPIWFRNACGALAVGAAGYGSGWGTSRKLAESAALQTCRKFTSACEIRQWVCTTR